MRNTPLRAFAKKSPLRKPTVRKDTDWMDMEMKRKKTITGSPILLDEDDKPKVGTGDAYLGMATQALGAIASAQGDTIKRGDAPSMKMKFGRQ